MGVHNVIVDLTITVIVEIVAEFDCKRVDVTVPIVTIGAVGHIASRVIGRAKLDSYGQISIAITICIRVVENRIGGVVINAPIAVIIHLVADFKSTRVDRGITVATIRGVAHIARGLVAGQQNAGRIAVAIGIRIGIPGLHSPGINAVVLIINETITVIVNAVADFRGFGIDVCIAVITVDAVSDVAGGLGAGQLSYPSIAKPIAVGIGIPGGGVGGIVVDAAIAIIVFLITDFGGAGVDDSITVVAISIVLHPVASRRRLVTIHRDRSGSVAVAVKVLVPEQPVHRVLVDAPITVVIHLIAEFICAGVDCCIGVVTVTVVTVTVAIRICVVVLPVIGITPYDGNCQENPWQPGFEKNLENVES